MKDFNNDGKVDKKDYQIFEDINEIANPPAMLGRIE